MRLKILWTATVARPGTFQVGNTISSKGRLVERTIERALAQDDHKRLRAGVEKLLDLFAEGERWAMEYVRDTLDGRPTQRIDANITAKMSDIGILANAIANKTIELDED